MVACTKLISIPFEKMSLSKMMPSIPVDNETTKTEGLNSSAEAVTCRICLNVAHEGMSLPFRYSNTGSRQVTIVADSLAFLYRRSVPFGLLMQRVASVLSFGMRLEMVLGSNKRRKPVGPRTYILCQVKNKILACTLFIRGRACESKWKLTWTVQCEICDGLLSGSLTDMTLDVCQFVARGLKPELAVRATMEKHNKKKLVTFDGKAASSISTITRPAF